MHILCKTVVGVSLPKTKTKASHHLTSNIRLRYKAAMHIYAPAHKGVPCPTKTFSILPNNHGAKDAKDAKDAQCRQCLHCLVLSTTSSCFCALEKACDRFSCNTNAAFLAMCTPYTSACTAQHQHIHNDHRPLRGASITQPLLTLYSMTGTYSKKPVQTLDSATNLNGLPAKAARWPT